MMSPTRRRRRRAITPRDGCEKGPGAAAVGFWRQITTYRKLAEAATDAICRYFPGAGPAWTRDAPLPGGDFVNHAELEQRYSKQYPWLPDKLRKRFVRTYGTLTETLLQDCGSLSDLGECFGSTLYAQEVRYLVTHEWAQTREDILWRRTKLGLHLQHADLASLDSYIESLVTGLKAPHRETATG